MQIKNVLFDLDGTLVNSFQAITNCLCYAVEKLDQQCPPKEDLAVLIGTPIRETFETILESSDKILIEKAVEFYRERYSDDGIGENIIYEDIMEMLDEISSLSCQLFVATTKAETIAKKTLKHLSLDSYFIKIYGSELGGRFEDKAELISELITKHNFIRDETLMVGDRNLDIIAAKKNNILSLGVTYGFGSREELERAEADYICDNPLEIANVIKFHKSNLSYLKNT